MEQYGKTIGAMAKNWSNMAKQLKQNGKALEQYNRK
jgi:hypothetical protein